MAELLSSEVSQQSNLWSAELEAKLQRLSPRQQRAIVRIVLGELAGYPLNRMLKDYKSCPWCGMVSGTKDRQKKHEPLCPRRGQPWRFACNMSTFYQHWSKSAEFMDCLRLARQEVTGRALAEATQLLQLSTPIAAQELRRQVEHGERESDRRQAAIAILDRADLKTSAKIQEHNQLYLWLEELRKCP